MKPELEKMGNACVVFEYKGKRYEYDGGWPEAFLKETMNLRSEMDIGLNGPRKNLKMK